MNANEGRQTSREIKPDTDPGFVMPYLYRHTDLQSTFSYNMTCLVPIQGGHADEADGEDGRKERVQPMPLGLKAILRHFLAFRLETVRRRFEFELKALLKRIHVLEGFR